MKTESYGCKSFPKTQYRTEAYRLARVILQKGKIESLSVDEVKNYGILTTNEVKVLVSLSSDKPEFLRYKLGATCGLGVSEIQNLQVKDIVLDYDWLIVKKPDTSRFIPYIDIVRELITKSVNKDSKSRYVIPNLRNRDKPCDPTTITRGLQVILKHLKIDEARYIRPSCLQETFINILHECDAPVETIGYLCGFKQEAGDESRIKSDKIKAIDKIQKILGLNPLSFMRWSYLK